MKQNQICVDTSYNRYPDIFNEIKEIIPNPKKILSFGCSIGLECQTLSDLYYPNSKIIGIDINKNIIAENKINNKYENIEYYSKINELNTDFDIIFAMSVLCKYGKNINQHDYTFEIFTETLQIIDKLLNKDGYLCIYNSKYLFTETKIFKEKYKIVETKFKETGYVPKYTYNNKSINKQYSYFLFKKIR